MQLCRDAAYGRQVSLGLGQGRPTSPPAPAPHVPCVSLTQQAESVSLDKFSGHTGLAVACFAATCFAVRDLPLTCRSSSDLSGKQHGDAGAGGHKVCGAGGGHHEERGPRDSEPPAVFAAPAHHPGALIKGFRGDRRRSGFLGCLVARSLGRNRMTCVIFVILGPPGRCAETK